MGNTTESPNMGLPIPTPTVDPGPEWAFDLNSCLDLIDSHNHSAGQGVQITPSGINISSDLLFNGFNATLLRSTRFYPLVSAPASASPDQNCLYSVGSELYYNDKAGNQVQITSGGSVNSGPGSINGLPSGTASANFVAIGGTFTWFQATSTAANMDTATLVVRYPGSYPTPSGNYIMLSAPNTLASTNHIFLPTVPATTGVMQLTNAGVINTISYDAVGQNMTDVGANAIGASLNSSTSANSIISFSNNANLGGKAAQESGKNLVVSNTNTSNSLAIIRGLVQSNGTIASGEGFTLTHVGTGNWNINFSTAFGDFPVIVGSTVGFFIVATNGTTGANINTYNTSTTLADLQFNFIAIGQRA
jgi:hypothetical protein